MKKLLFALLLVGLLVACGNNDNENTEEDHPDHDHEEVIDSLVPLEAEILMEDELSIGEHTLSAKVNHGDELVTDADKVMFEVWQGEVSGKDEHSEMIEAEHVGEGIYETTYSFEEVGTYQVQVHVDARHQHTMPIHELEIVD